jgi:hypothetical protein
MVAFRVFSMKPLVIMAVSLASGASAQSWKITATGKVIDKTHCYTFQMPKGWKGIWGNPIPLLFHFAPGSRPVQLQTLPPGAASLAVAPGPLSRDKTKSIEEWIKWRRREYPSSSIREVRYPPGTGITRAVEMRWTDEEIDPDEPKTRTIALFFDFRGHPSDAYLSFYQTDKRRAQYLAALAEVIGSLRPLRGYAGCSE